MIQQQPIQSTITILQGNSNITKLKIFKCLKLITKTFQQYVNNPEVLPSETFIPCCLFVAPKRFKQLFGILQSQDCLEDLPEKTSQRLCLQLYLKNMLRLLQESSDEIKHIIISGMIQCVPLLIPYKILLKKWIKSVIDLWANETQQLNIPLRCHLFISQTCQYFSDHDKSMFMWILRRVYVAYFESSKQVSWRNYQHVNFMVNCFCQIVRIDADRSYYVLFGYLRSIALQLDKLNKAKRKEKVDLINKLFSNQILNSIKLFTAVISRVDAEGLTALVYPLCELIVGYERISESSQFIPLKLHLLEYELTMSQALHMYIPHTLELLQKFINLPIFSKKLKKKSQKVEANIELAYRLSLSQLQQALLINQIFESLLTKVYYFVNIVSKMVAGPQILQKLGQTLKQNNYIYSQYKLKANKAYQNIRADIDELYEQRLSKSMKIQDNKSIKNYQITLEKICDSSQNKLSVETLKCPKIYMSMQKETDELVRQKLAAEDQQDQGEGDQDDSVIEDDDEVNSGWEQASEGASQFQQEQLIQNSEEQIQQQQISYEGDPEDADQAAKQWSEQQWDSQDDI